MRIIHNIFLYIIIWLSCKVALNESNEVNHHTDFCPRLQAVYDGEVLVEHALKDMNISVALSLRNGEDNPIWKIMLDAVAKKGKFNVIYFETGGIAENQTWTDKLFAELSIYDLYADWWSRKMDRLNKGVLFPEGWWEADTIMVVKTEEKQTLDFWAFAAPFSGNLWILIVCVTLFTGMMYVFMDYLRSRRTGDYELDSDFMRTLYRSFQAFVGHSEFDPKGAAMRLLTLSMNFMFLILISAYTANLASFLVVKNSSKVEINEFSDVMTLRANVCVQRGYPYIDTVSSKYPGSKSLMIEYDSQKEMYQALQNGDCIVLLSSMEDWKTRQRDDEYNIGCGMKWAGRRIESMPAGFALRTSRTKCRAVLHDVLDFWLIQMRADGTIQEIWDNYRDFHLANTCDTGVVVKKKASVTQLNVFNMAGIFLFHLALLLIAVFGELTLFCFQPKDMKLEVKQEMKHELYESKNKAVKIQRESVNKLHFRRNTSTSSTSAVVGESETSALNVPSVPEEQVLLTATEGAPISRRDVALHIEKMEQRFAMDLKELKIQLNVEQTDHSSNSDTSLSNNSPNASQCSAT